MKEEKEYKTLTFSITGEFVTKTAREWLFEDHKPYAVVEEFLLSCMIGTDIPIKTLKRMAQDVLLGRARFIGNTADGTYDYETIEDSDESLSNKFFDKWNKSQIDFDEITEKYNYATHLYLDLYDSLTRYINGDEELEDVEFQQNKRIMIDLADSLKYVYHAANAAVDFANSKDSSTHDILLDSFLKADKFEDNYGFVKPDGTFIPVEWCNHLEYGEQAVKENGWEDEFNKWQLGDIHSNHTYNGLCAETDFIVYEKGWILLHSPAQGIAIPTYNETKGMTKAQRDFLFDYYIKRNEETLANKYWKEDNFN